MTPPRSHRVRTLRLRAFAALQLLLIAASSDVALAFAPAEEEHTSWVPAIAKFVNFAMLAGILVYFLPTPIATCLRNRSETIRKDLVESAALRSSAEKQLADMRTRQAALPAELEALKRRGQEELAAERRFFDTRKPGVLAKIADKKILDDDLKKELGAALEEFGKQFAAAPTAA
jgi:ATP synthase B/B' subunit